MAFLKANLNVIENQKLHGSPIVMDASKLLESIIHTSSRNDIPNEVDLAQFLILRDRISSQYVMTPKYIFLFSWDKAIKRTSEKGFGK
jgi:hypothetical protein